MSRCTSLGFIDHDLSFLLVFSVGSLLISFFEPSIFIAIPMSQMSLFGDAIFVRYFSEVSKALYTYINRMKPLP